MNVGNTKKSGKAKTLTAGGLALMAALAFGCLTADYAQAQTIYNITGGNGGNGGIGATSDLGSDAATGGNGTTGTNTPDSGGQAVAGTPSNGSNSNDGIKGGAGGAGESFTGSISSSTITDVDSLVLRGGRGGNGGDSGVVQNSGQAGDGGLAGAAGSVTYTLDVSSELTGISLTGGNGGNGGTRNTGAGGTVGDPTAGADGGKVILKDAGSGTVTSLTGTLALSNGAAGTTANSAAVGNGGNVEADIAGTLRFTGTTGAINLTKTAGANDGLIKAGINTLLVEGESGGSTLTINKTGTLTANDSVKFNTIKLDSTNGAATFDSFAVAHNVTDGFSFNNIYVVGGNIVPASASTLTLSNALDTTGVNLIFDASEAANNATMLTVTNGIDLSGITSVSQVQVVANSKADFYALAGKEITLIADGSVEAITGGIYNNATNTVTTTSVSQMGTSRYYFDYTTTADAIDQNLIFKGGAGVGEYSAGHAYAQAAVAGLQTTADSFTINTMSTVDDVVGIADPGTFALTGRASYFSLKTDTGSHADIDTVAASIAGGYKIESGAGLTTLGAFFEYGKGDYDTSALIAGWGDVTGDGEATNVGGGLFARHDFNQGTYLEGSARFGNVDQEYSINNVIGSRFDLDADYWGLHFGLGHKFAVTDMVELDIYGKFFYTSLDGLSGLNGLGERLDIDAADSVRTRLGGRVTQSFADCPVRLYYGAAWEHEFDGESGAMVDGVRTAKADVGGSSGFGELGLVFKPENAGYALEVGAFGLVGTQEGGGGTVSLKFDF